MAKRFTDTKLGREKWFRVLKPAMKCAVRFLFDECDEAGCWPIDEDAMEFYIGARVLLKELVDAVNADGKRRLMFLGRDKLFIPGFIEFQYGELSDQCKPHQKVIRRLKELTLWEGYTKGFHTLEEEEEDKEEEEETEKDKEEEEEKEEEQKLDFDALYKKYPRKEGKSKGIKKLKSEITTWEDFQKLSLAIANYAASRIGQDATFTKHFSTFASEWRDWIDFKPSDAPPLPLPSNPAYRRMQGNQLALEQALKALEDRNDEAS